MKNIATLMNKTISEIKRDGSKITFYDQDANPMFQVDEENSHGYDTFWDEDGNFFDFEPAE